VQRCGCAASHNPSPPLLPALGHSLPLQTLKVFPGTPRDELLAGIREVLGIAIGAPLRFRDADGDVVMLSSMMPSGTVLHVEVASGAAPPPAAVGPEAAAARPTAPAPAPAPAPAATPAPAPAAAASGAGEPDFRCWSIALGGEINGGGRGFTAGRGSEGHCEAWWAGTPGWPATGRHYFVLNVTSTRACCISLQLTPASQTAGEGTHMSEAPCAVALNGVGSPDVRTSWTRSAGPGRIGILWDADTARVLWLDHDHPETHPALYKKVPTPCRLFLQAPKHGIVCTILTAAEAPPPPASVIDRLLGTLPEWKGPE
jgi:hypothetical protein